MSQPTDPSVPFLAASDSSLGQLGEFSAQYAQFSDADIDRWLSVCRTMSITAVVVAFPAGIIRGWIGWPILIVCLLFLLGPGLAMRGLENERQTRARRREIDEQFREQVRTRRTIMEDVANAIYDEEEQANRERARAANVVTPGAEPGTPRPLRLV